MRPKSLLDFEHYFAQQLIKLEQIPWACLQIKMIDQVVRNIRSAFPDRDQQSYFTELIPIVHHVFQTAQDQMHYIDPAILVRTIDWVQKDWFYSQSEHREKLHTLLQNISRIICRTYFRLGDLTSLHRFLVSNRLFTDNPDKYISKFPDSRARFLEQFQTYMSQSITQGLYRELESAEFSNDTFCGLFAVRQNDVKAGILGKITLSHIELARKEGPDQLLISTHLIREEDIIAEQTRVICQFLRTQAGIAGDMQIRIKFALDQPTSLLSGNSVGLLLTLLAEYGLRDYRKKNSWEPQFNQRTVFTGAIEKDGTIVEVNEADIPAKIEAAFFGPTQTVVIPQKHQETAHRKYTALQNRFPNRMLSILPASHISDIQDHPNVVHLHKRSLPQRIHQFIDIYAIPLSIIAVILFSVGSIGLYEFVIKNQVPERLETQENCILVENSYGVVLWQSESYSSEDVAQYYQDLAQITDLDNDGKLEVLLVYDESTIQGFRNTVVCYGADGEIDWKQNIPDISSDQTITGLKTVDINNDPYQEIQLSIANNTGVQYQILVFSHTGERLR